MLGKRTDFLKVFTLAIDAFCIAALPAGLGLHVWRVIKEDPDPPRNLIRSAQAGYAVGVFQGLGLMFTKLSILAFYHRIFTARKRVFKLCLAVVGIYVIFVGVSSTFEQILQRQPIHYYWDRLILLTGLPPPPSLVGSCLPQIPSVAVPLFAGLLSDVVILVPPAIGLWNWQLAREKKFGVYAALSLGIFACAIEVVRICYCFRMNDVDDDTWDDFGIVIWTAVELSVAIVCACIPATAPLLKQTHKRRYVKWHAYDNSRSCLRFDIFAKSHTAKQRGDDNSSQALNGGSAATHVTPRAAEDPYSCTIVHDLLDCHQGHEPGTPMLGIQVSKQLNISHSAFRDLESA
ncbi:hypothetical protein MMC17_001557 [Xylographa soralifera]|nr:hypothetical protein [Xylographa soralifera]